MRGHRLRRGLLFAAGGLVVLLVGAYVYLQSPPLWFISLDPPEIPAADDAGAARMLFIAPHPDDDILSAGGAMALTQADGGTVLVVYLTSGDAARGAKRLITMNPFHSARGYRALGNRRQKEAVLALDRLGIPASSAVFLNYPDQGLIELMAGRGSCEAPYRSRFTKAQATYSDVAFHPGELYCGENLLADLVEIIRRYRPTVVYVPHPLDAHTDHAAGYYFGVLAVQTALLADPNAAPHTVRCYMTHSFEKPWPNPRGIGLGRALELLPVFVGSDPWESIHLPEWAVRAKLAAIRAHASQWWTSRNMLASFVRTNELWMDVVVDVDEETSSLPIWRSEAAGR